MSLRPVSTAFRVLAIALVLAAANPPPANAQGQIAIGQSVQGMLTPGSPVMDSRPYNLYMFFGNAGQSIQIDMVAPQNTIDSYLVLQDQNGNELETDDDGGDGNFNSRITYTLPYAGMYRILAMSYRTSGVMHGMYTLTLSGQGGYVPGMVTGGGQITFGQTVQGALTPQSMVLEGRPYDLYTFQGNAGQQIQIDMAAPNNTIDSYLRFQDQNGNDLQTNDDGAGNLNSRITYTLPYTGMYRILAMSLRTSGVMHGMYTLSLSAQGMMMVPTGPMTMGGQISVGQTVQGALTPQSMVLEGRPYNMYTFYGNAGQQIQIDMMAPQNTIDSYLRFQDQNGNDLQTNDDGAGNLNSRITYTLPYTGMYRILAMSLRTSGVMHGMYTLSVSGQGGYVPGMVTGGGQIGFGQTVQGQLTPASSVLNSRPYDLYTFYGNAGQQIQIDMIAPPNTIDPYLTFQDQNGNNLQTNDDGGGYPNSRITYTLPYSGMYRILAMSFRTSGVMHGMYTLSLR